MAMVPSSNLPLHMNSSPNKKKNRFPPSSSSNIPASHSIEKKNNNKMRSRLSELCKQGQPDMARRLFDTLPRPTSTLLWNTIIIGFICNGMPHDALRFYARMVTANKSDSYTYSSLLKACADTRQLKLGKIMHCRVLRSHSKLTTIVGNSLLNMYTSCLNGTERFDLVGNVFDRMSKRNVVAWNTIIAWYVKMGRYSKALMQFRLMMDMGIKPTVVSFVNVFPAVAAVGDKNNADVLYGLVLKLGTDYVNDLFAVSSAISMYSDFDDVDTARKVFDLSWERNIQVWNTMIGGYVQNDCYRDGLDLFFRVLELDKIVVPDTVTFLASLTAVSQLQWLDLGQQLHAYVVKNSLASEVIISNVIISMYSRCNSVEAAFKVFDKMMERDLVSWNTMVSAFVQNGFDGEGLMLVYEMKKQGLLIDSVTATALLSAASNLKNCEIGKQTHAYLFRHGIRFEGMDSYLIDMYSKSGLIDTAQLLFNNNCIHNRDHVTWNAMIAGYAQNGEIEEAFIAFRQMLKHNELPNSVTLASLLPACIPSGGISLGKQIHGYAIRHSIDHNVFVGTALIDMYSKCASIRYAEKVCDSIPEKNTVTYTTIILGYGQHGLGDRALSMFQTMSEFGMNPDAITFVAILSACSYSGLVDKGLKIFESMECSYGILPTTEHYCCVVDMLGRAGRVVEAYEFVKALGDRGSAAGIWGSLLGACRMHGEMELGRIISDRLFEVEEDNDVTGYHVLLSNIYADKEMWDSAERVRKDMREKGLRKETGCSWIEIGSVVNCFTSKDQKHPQCDAIYAKLAELALEMKEAGYIPSFSCSNGDVPG
ncbi:hypothetical protein IFM89_038951 [Coptis chinensis]|uniref:Pentatricopeptide repeat-containing protein n=1 Tax=Coptis chinensis TaxID=261450 RepID=A0A835J045_9MAGN|nr:hypothetical protein IFM89_038951 [Coptis chinensis]